MDTRIGSVTTDQGIAVTVQITLDPRERNRLFISGDVLLELPADGAVPIPSSAPIERTSMFLSELAGSRDGVTRVFADAPSAERFAAGIRKQLDAIDHDWSTHWSTP